MMELLKRFEESNAEEGDLGDEDGDGDALAKRLEGIDLGMLPFEVQHLQLIFRS